MNVCRDVPGVVPALTDGQVDILKYQNDLLLVLLHKRRLIDPDSLASPSGACGELQQNHS